MMKIKLLEIETVRYRKDYLSYRSKFYDNDSVCAFF